MEKIGKGKYDEFKERCQQICGKSSPLCFNNKQVACISDMVINKVYGVKTIVDRLREANQCEETAEFLDMASESVNELVYWVRYLQKAKQGGDRYVSKI